MTRWVSLPNSGSDYQVDLALRLNEVVHPLQSTWHLGFHLPLLTQNVQIRAERGLLLSGLLQRLQIVSGSGEAPASNLTLRSHW